MMVEKYPSSASGYRKPDPPLTAMADDSDQQQQREFLAKRYLGILTHAIEKSCLPRCLGKHAAGSGLDKNEQLCLAKCTDRFLDSWNIVSQAVVQIQNIQMANAKSDNFDNE